MIKAGVFDSLKTDRFVLFSNIEEILSYSQNVKKSRNGGSNGSSQNNLFGSSYSSPSFLKKLTMAGDKNNEFSAKEKLGWERELLGFYLSGHPLEQYQSRLKNDNIKSIKELLASNGRTFNGNGCRIAGVISKIHRIISKAGQPIVFVTIEDIKDSLEVVVFSDALAKNPEVWKENNVVTVSGRLSWRNNEPKFVCQQVTEL